MGGLIQMNRAGNNRALIQLVVACFAFASMSLCLGCQNDFGKTIEIYYAEWQMEIYAGLTCDRLRLSKLANKATIKKESEVMEFARKLDSAKLVEHPSIKELDVRICCYMNIDGALIHMLSFTRASLMETGGKIYTTDEELFKLVLKYLPEDYLGT